MKLHYIKFEDDCKLKLGFKMFNEWAQSALYAMTSSPPLEGAKSLFFSTEEAER